MIDRRGLSQVVFGFLPHQTADLKNKVWKVVRWSDARGLPVDPEVVREELLRAVYPWEQLGTDGGLVQRLREGLEVSVVSPSEDGGVAVEPFPELYRCQSCGRLSKSNTAGCLCGKQRWGQINWVAFHDCGRLETPWIPQCPEHKQVRFLQTGSPSLAEIVFDCPVCQKVISKGPPVRKCECGNGIVMHNPHRAAVVYQPRTTVIVNPPSQADAAALRSAAGRSMTLEWALDGMRSDTPAGGKPTVDVLYETFVAQGTEPAIARAMAEAAFAASGQTEQQEQGVNDIDGAAKEAATAGAVRLAYATMGGRLRVPHLIREAGPAAKQRFELLYPPALERGRLLEVELLERFPVLTAAFGYTRGGGDFSSQLQWFKGPSGGLRIHGQQADTEALLFRLDPVAVADYLHQQGALPQPQADPRAARVAIAKAAVLPQPGQIVDPSSTGACLLTLIHSYSHRVIRRISGFCGIDRDSLSEYLVPQHLAFAVYATSRGDFVLGGLQAVFEHDLDKVIDDVVGGEHRCALDPGCEKEGGACVACLHVGEPSCRYYNQYLDRAALFAAHGYLAEH
jgi:hypothetical protein